MRIASHLERRDAMGFRSAPPLDLPRCDNSPCVKNNSAASGKCPVMHGGATASSMSNMEWWPRSLNLDILHQHDTKTDPMGGSFNAYENMGLKIFGFGFGHEDIWHPEKGTYWGSEKEWLASTRYEGENRT